MKITLYGIKDEYYKTTCGRLWKPSIVTVHGTYDGTLLHDSHSVETAKNVFMTTDKGHRDEVLCGISDGGKFAWYAPFEVEVEI